ncbi:Dammarenediol 12-hydroxylase [Clarias magur]|uniref:Dammarenediol 12-hydroxylase n=1 Tax=Clarias magur TaxID=1594786 RepID=A0A8J4T4B9_CLAMG|nr:Dammarenediol 12-hydroxylase [Clarias magur]
MFQMAQMKLWCTESLLVCVRPRVLFHLSIEAACSAPHLLPHPMHPHTLCFPAPNRFCYTQ